MKNKNLVCLISKELTLKERILNVVAPEETYTFSEYKELKEAKENTGEYIAKKILNDPRVKKMAVFFLGSMLYLNNLSVEVMASTGPNVTKFNSKVNEIGNMFVGIIQTIGYWTCLIMCAVEILKCLFQGDTKSLTKIICKYLMAFAGLYVLPWIFELIKSMFS